MTELDLSCAPAVRAPAAERASAWHVGPLVDSLAYHWSWLPLLALILPFGAQEEDYLFALLLVLAVNFSHRHLTLPYVYLDKQVFKRHPLKFTVFPGLMLALFLCAPLLDHTPAMAALAAIAGLWNMWHVYMQKYGILRMYAAKDPGARAPAWLDRAMILGWLPLYFAWLGPKNREVALDSFASARPFTEPLLDALALVRPWLVPLTVALALSAQAGFWLGEWRTSRLRNRPRALMALGTTALSLALLVFDPVKVYLSFGFSHAVEYTVFVWAFQRRRYARPLPHRPLLGRLMTRPWLYHGAIVLGLGALYIVLVYWGRYVFVGRPPLRLAGVSSARWMFYWAVFQSMVHFYYDGFLWKMRLPTVRENL